MDICCVMHKESETCIMIDTHNAIKLKLKTGHMCY